jgi:hypothetical protein
MSVELRPRSSSPAVGSAAVARTLDGDHWFTLAESGSSAGRCAVAAAARDEDDRRVRARRWATAETSGPRVASPATSPSGEAEARPRAQNERGERRCDSRQTPVMRREQSSVIDARRAHPANPIPDRGRPAASHGARSEASDHGQRRGAQPVSASTRGQSRAGQRRPEHGVRRDGRLTRRRRQPAPRSPASLAIAILGAGRPAGQGSSVGFNPPTGAPRMRRRRQRPPNPPDNGRRLRSAGSAINRQKKARGPSLNSPMA